MPSAAKIVENATNCVSFTFELLQNIIVVECFTSESTAIWKMKRIAQSSEYKQHLCLFHALPYDAYAKTHFSLLVLFRYLIELNGFG